jgi:hypothetical protein
MDKIKRFCEFCEERDMEQGLGDIDAQPNEEESLLKMAQLAINRHQERFLDFFHSLAKHDDDIRRILGEFRDKRSNYLPKDLRKGSEEEKDIVAPNTADMSGPI